MTQRSSTSKTAILSFLNFMRAFFIGALLLGTLSACATSEYSGTGPSSFQNHKQFFHTSRMITSRPTSAVSFRN